MCECVKHLGVLSCVVNNRTSKYCTTNAGVQHFYLNRRSGRIADKLQNLVPFIEWIS